MKKINVNKVIGKMIRKHRIEKGLTQIELAKYLGYTTPQFISLFERGMSKVPYETLGLLCKSLDISRHEVEKIIMDGFERNLKKEIEHGHSSSKKLPGVA